METKIKEKIGMNVSEVDMSSKEAPFIIYEMKYSNLENKIDALEKERNLLKEEILNKFEEVYGHESISITNNLTGNTLQRVISVLKSIDEDAARKVILPHVWEKVTTRKISRDLFFAAIRMGDISAREVAHAIETKEVDKIVIRTNKRDRK